MTIKPGAGGSGIVFRRVDRPDSPPIPGTLSAVCDADRRTLLGTGDATVGTVEHLMAAMVALKIDDAVVEIDGPEVPALDGSAAPFVRALSRAGTVATEGSVRTHRPHGPLELTYGRSKYQVEPANELTLAVSIQWDHPLIGRQCGTFHTDAATFTQELAPARTFGFAREAEALAARGLARGATVENTLILTNEGLVAGTLRWPDEFVRHKALDLLGDLALLGTRIHAVVTAERPSHQGNIALVRALQRNLSSKE